MNGISDAEIIDMLQKMVRQRQESIEMYTKGNRPELAAKEQGEIDVINRYLPKQLSDADTEAAIAAIVAETGASSIKDMGKVMGLLKERFAGQLDFAQGRRPGEGEARLRGTALTWRCCRNSWKSCAAASRSSMSWAGACASTAAACRRPGFCPFHNEKSPSFHVYEGPDEPHYHCFGCGAHGDVITFVMETEGMQFRDAVEKLAGEAGLEIPRDNPEARERAERQDTLAGVMELSAKFFESQLGGSAGRAASTISVGAA